MKYATLILLSIFCLSACQKTRTPCIYEIPAGYTGWVIIEFECPDANAIPQKNGNLFFRIEASGRLRTSSKQEYGWASDRYFDSTGLKMKQTSWGEGGMIWAGSTGSSQKANGRIHYYQTFFVGSEDAYRKSIKNLPELE
jgi:hypothetical protein